MENQNFINALIGGGFAILGWFARELWAAVRIVSSEAVTAINATASIPALQAAVQVTWPTDPGLNWVENN